MIFYRQLFLTAAAIFFCIGTAAAEKYTEKLMQKGFPRDYAEKLAILHKKYPAWQFEPLLVTRMDRRYTWQYVLMMETDAAPSRSLISGNRYFSAYFHPDDTREYDAGCRRASVAATAYFLDPRNYLNECDIFQFKNLQSPGKVPVRAVKSALKGTFMYHGILENGQTYAQFLCRLARGMNIDPVFLASRLRQEQGLHGTPLVSGQCGTLLLLISRQQQQRTFSKLMMNCGKSILWIYSGSNAPAENEKYLLQYNGLYNFFNINAGGNGKFTILLNGMKEAQTGTPEMSTSWNSARWDKKWKAIFGGALKVTERYIGNYQNTMYLQKWNVDPRCRTAKGYSRNFWGQYMQNIGASFSEARNFYRSLKKHRLLKLPNRFLIPVYDNMPSSPAPDPAQGKCRYYRSFNFTETPDAGK